jgi:predicted metallo-beta-lactamase superfamily hydrolase
VRILRRPPAKPKLFFYGKNLMKYPYKTEKQKQRCQELQEKADRMANNIKYAKNKKLAVRSFLQCLYLSI